MLLVFNILVCFCFGKVKIFCSKNFLLNELNKIMFKSVTQVRKEKIVEQKTEKKITQTLVIFTAAKRTIFLHNVSFLYVV